MGFALLSVLFGAGEILLLAHLFQLYSPILLMGGYYLFTVVVTLVRRQSSPEARGDQSWREHKKNLLVYAVGGAFGNALWFASLFLMGPSYVAILSMVHRVVIMIYSTRYMNEPMSPWQWVISIVMIGLTGAFSSQGDEQSQLGLALCIAAYVVFSFSDIAHKHLSSKVPWTTALTLRQMTQLVLFGSASLYYAITVSGFEVYASWSLWALLIAAALMGGVLSKICHYHAVSALPLSRVVLVSQLEAVLVFVAGAVLFANVSLWSLQGAAGLGVVGCLLLFLRLEQSRVETVTPTS